MIDITAKGSRMPHSVPNATKDSVRSVPTMFMPRAISHMVMTGLENSQPFSQYMCT